MKTIINIKTWGCVCGYHQGYEPVILLCPSCKQHNLVIETEPDKQVITTTIDEADILNEIIKIKKRQEEGMSYEEDDDVSTKEKEEIYLAKRIKETELAVEEMNKRRS